ncbi:MAG: glutathione S-transferase family protein [Burkholderiales bacterium]|nr:glutathione S-transferase family protein [Burkholderiales bacterium]
MLLLYHYGTAVCAAKVRIVLAEKNLPWESRIVLLGLDGGKPGPGVLTQHDPEYLKLNPNGVVPTLVHDGRVIIESTVINEYLDEAFPAVSLRPADPFLRAQMRLWTKRLDEGLHAAAGILMNAVGYRHRYLAMTPEMYARYMSEVKDPEKREVKRQVIERGTEAAPVVYALRRFQSTILDIEARLAASPWLCGDAYSIADASYTPYMFRLETMQMSELWEVGCPRVCDWYRRMKLRPSFHAGVIAPAVAANLELLREKGAQEWPKLRTKLLSQPIPQDAVQ